MAKNQTAKSDSIDVVRQEVAAFKASPLYKFRVANGYVPVIGEGSQTARLVFVGEAPGKNEAMKGKPFCGASGRILDEMLASIKMNRANVYVTNLVNDRPPENRDPSPEEIALYGPFLDRQLAIIRPKVVATLGRHSMKYLFERYGNGQALRPISEIHGTEFAVTAPWGTFTLVALYHPAVALYKGSMKKVLLEDFKRLEKYKQ